MTVDRREPNASASLQAIQDASCCGREGGKKRNVGVRRVLSFGDNRHSTKSVPTSDLQASLSFGCRTLQALGLHNYMPRKRDTREFERVDGSRELQKNVFVNSPMHFANDRITNACSSVLFTTSRSYFTPSVMPAYARTGAHSLWCK
jgi:hypothetical protein